MFGNLLTNIITNIVTLLTALFSGSGGLFQLLIELILGIVGILG